MMAEGDGEVKKEAVEEVAQQGPRRAHGRTVALGSRLSGWGGRTGIPFVNLRIRKFSHLRWTNIAK